MNTDAGLGNWEDNLCVMKEAFDITTITPDYHHNEPGKPEIPSNEVNSP